MKDIDAILIATPDRAHPRILANAGAAGKDAYVEQPFAVDLADAKMRGRPSREPNWWFRRAPNPAALSSSWAPYGRTERSRRQNRSRRN
jgi:hypothetical protein